MSQNQLTLVFSKSWGIWVGLNLRTLNSSKRYLCQKLAWMTQSRSFEFEYPYFFKYINEWWWIYSLSHSNPPRPQIWIIILIWIAISSQLSLAYIEFQQTRKPTSQYYNPHYNWIHNRPSSEVPPAFYQIGYRPTFFLYLKGSQTNSLPTLYTICLYIENIYLIWFIRT